MTTTQPENLVGEYQWGFHDDEQPLFIAEKGLNEEKIRQMSAMKGEPEWMLEQRLEAYQQFLALENPKWAGSPEKLEAIAIALAVAMIAVGWALLVEYFRMTARARPYQLVRFAAAAAMVAGSSVAA